MAKKSSKSPANGAATLEVKNDENAKIVPLGLIDADPDQPRKVFDEASLTQLGRSMASIGQMQPVVLRPGFEGRFVIVDGERRVRAANLARLETIHAVISATSEPADVLEAQMIANTLREDVSPIEQAQAYKRLKDLRGCSLTVLAAKLCVDKAEISRSLTLLEATPELQKAVHDGKIPAQSAYELSKIKDVEEQKKQTAEVVSSGENREAVKARVSSVQAQAAKTTPLVSNGKGGPVPATAKGPSAGRPKNNPPIPFHLDNGCSIVVQVKRGFKGTVLELLGMALDMEAARPHTLNV